MCPPSAPSKEKILKVLRQLDLLAGVGVPASRAS
jgi:hypothetical protein